MLSASASAYLQKREIIDYGPTTIRVFDFDERICSAVKRFADRERIDALDSRLYNCLEPFPEIGAYERFYTNPPWGASNDGESVKVFVQRGMEATAYAGEGMIVIADDSELEWCQQVLANVQSFAIESGYFVQRMMSQLHRYHLDDAPDLRSCNLVVKGLPGTRRKVESLPITDPARLENFYGRGNNLRVRYIKEKKRVDYGKAHDDEYSLELL